MNPGVSTALSTLLVFACLYSAGCGRAGSDTHLPLREVRPWAVPLAGRALPAPRAMANGPDDMILSIDTLGRILVLGADGSLVTSWMMPETEVGRPEAIRLLRDGRIVVADTHYHRLVFFSTEGKLLGMQGTKGTGDGQFIYPVALAEDAAGNLYVAEYGSNDRIQKFAPDGTHALSFGSFGTGTEQFQRPSGLVWHNDRVYVADAINNRIQVFSDAGHYITTLGTTPGDAVLRYPYDMALTPEHNLAIVEYTAGRVTLMTPEGRRLGHYGSTGPGPGQLRTPWGLTVTPTGHIIVADTGNRRFMEFVP